MKKNSLIGILLLSFICVAPTLMAINTHIGRLDFLSKEGNRLFSIDPNYGGLQDVFSVTKAGEDWEIVYFTYNDSDYIKRTDLNTTIKVIPWGSEKYDLNFESSVPVFSELKSSKESVAKVKAKSNARINVLSGDTIVFWLTLPQGACPEMKWRPEYTDHGWFYEYSGKPFNEYYVNVFDHKSITDQAYLNQYLAERINGHGIFTPIKNNPDGYNWKFEMEMPNEPISMIIDYVYPDSKMLREVADVTLYGTLYTQYQRLPIITNGESSIEFNADNLSQDYITIANIANLNLDESYLKPNTGYGDVPWAVCFQGIMRANIVLDNLDMYQEVSVDEKEIVRAQMLALRSHCYIRILQFYGKRWSESDNGSAYCAPLILSTSDIEKPLSTMKDIFRRVEFDLNTAEDIFRNKSYTRTDIIQPDLYVTLALKMRLYQLAEDWEKVTTVANEILEKYQVSSNEDITSGFYTQRNSWIWGASSNFKDDNSYFIYYWAPQNLQAANGVYAQSGGGGSAIDRDLFLSIPQNDIRHSLFAMPEELSANLSRRARWAKLEWWYSSEAYNDNKISLTESSGPLTVIARYYDKKKPAGAICGAFNYGGPFSYDPYYHIPVTFGAQVKFIGSGESYGCGFTEGHPATLFLRSDEAMLSLIEANAMLGNEDEARELLTNYNKIRNPEYTCTATGDDLLEEIRLYRRIELWGEGHSWLDFKRWNKPIHRRVWVENDTTSGNWVPNEISKDMSVTAANGWRFMIPAYYVKQNSQLDISKMGYEDVSGYEETTDQAQKIPAMPKVAGVESAGFIQKRKSFVDREMKVIQNSK